MASLVTMKYKSFNILVGSNFVNPSVEVGVVIADSSVFV